MNTKNSVADVSRRILLSRFLTRAGDQAWDFAVPIVLLQVFPGEIQIAAGYYFLVRLAHVILMPHFAGYIDRLDRRKASFLGIGLQLASVIAAAALISQLNWVTLVLLVVAGVGSSLGSTFMDIAVGNDLIPAAVGGQELPRINGRLRQIDLFTEVAVPVVTGALLLVRPAGWPLLGFYLVALWNVVSFVPEYLLLRSIFLRRSDLLETKTVVSASVKQSFFSKFSDGWRSFIREPVAPAIACYAFLWLSVLSPHGVLLTGFLKDGWRVPEIWIGLFRGAGAIFGLCATVLYPIVVRRFGLLKSCRLFIQGQAFALLIALIGFGWTGGAGSPGQIVFLVFVLLSRIGLYGFSLGEMQIRQVGIRPQVRGEVNGFASAVTGSATLLLYGAGSLLSRTDDFRFLVFGSVVFVAIGAVLFSSWSRRAVIET